MYDPVEKAAAVAQIVCQGKRRKYYRFRAARFYGGIATADCLGCFLRCLFCWSWRQVSRPEAYGRFYSPREVAEKLVAIALKKGVDQVRISGNEPTLCREHLLEVLQYIPKNLRFILETNGILIGHDPSYAKALAAFNNLHVRVSLKGASEEEFSRLTGARPKDFALQLAALENLLAAGVSVHPAVMISFSSERNIEALRKRLARIAPAFADFEVEEVVLYGDTEKRLQKAGLEYRRAYRPQQIPPEQV